MTYSEEVSKIIIHRLYKRFIINKMELFQGNRYSFNGNSIVSTFYSALPFDRFVMDYSNFK